MTQRISLGHAAVAALAPMEGRPALIDVSEVEISAFTTFNRRSDPRTRLIPPWLRVMATRRWERTIEHHVSPLLTKLGAASRAEVIGLTQRPASASKK